MATTTLGAYSNENKEFSNFRLNLGIMMEYDGKIESFK